LVLYFTSSVSIPLLPLTNTHERTNYHANYVFSIFIIFQWLYTLYILGKNPNSLAWPTGLLTVRQPHIWKALPNWSLSTWLHIIVYLLPEMPYFIFYLTLDLYVPKFQPINWWMSS
jgi:hypothetical protein